MKKQQDFPITQEQFLAWRAPRFGTSNPTHMTNEVWKWLIETKINAWQATQDMKGPSPFNAGPTWSFDRFGQSTTHMPDGRIIHIGGEHEDYYDPDFYIYNDVVVKSSQGDITIYGYPQDIFPPTDFHSATLAGKTIIVIGNLGYSNTRLPQTNQVFLLDTDTFAITPKETDGERPGWIHDHNATLAPNRQTITITGGKLDRGKGSALVENIEDWQLNLVHWTWRRLSHRNWPRWNIRRADKQRNHLWEMRLALGSLTTNWMKDYHEWMEKIQTELGHTPDITTIDSLYKPEIHHESVPAITEEDDTYRIMIDGVTVRYVEDWYGVQMTVEGTLPNTVINTLLEDLQKKLSALENLEYEIEEIT